MIIKVSDKIILIKQLKDFQLFIPHLQEIKLFPLIAL